GLAARRDAALAGQRAHHARERARRALADHRAAGAPAGVLVGVAVAVVVEQIAALRAAGDRASAGPEHPRRAGLGALSTLADAVAARARDAVDHAIAVVVDVVADLRDRPGARASSPGARRA